MLDLLDPAAGRFDSLSRGFREAVRSNDERMRQFATRKYFDQLATARQARPDELLRADRAIRCKLLQISKVHRPVLDPISVREAAPVREPLDQRQLTALEVRRHATTRSRLLPLGSLTRGGAAP
jgi:hypothetical protein